MEPSHKENGHGIVQQNKTMTLIPLIHRTHFSMRYFQAADYQRFFVDQEGLEPSSKRGNNMLSTRLSLT